MLWQESTWTHLEEYPLLGVSQHFWEVSTIIILQHTVAESTTWDEANPLEDSDPYPIIIALIYSKLALQFPHSYIRRQ